MKLKMILLTLLAAVMVVSLSGAEGQTPNRAGTEALSASPNMLRMEGASPTCDGNVEYGPNFMQFARMADGTYTVVAYFDPQAVNTLVDDLNEQIRTGQFQYGSVRVWLGNLKDKVQRDKMPQGIVDLENHRVTFHGVKLTKGADERLNLPTKFYDASGAEIKIPNDNGGPLGRGYAWAWIPNTGATVTGTVHNGIQFHVEADGSLTPKPFNAKPAP